MPSTYESLYAHWPTAPRPNPFSDMLDKTQKYVATRTVTAPLPWVDSTLLDGDATAAVAALEGRRLFPEGTPSGTVELAGDRPSGE